MKTFVDSGKAIVAVLALWLPGPVGADAKPGTETRQAQIADTEPQPFSFAPVNNATSSKYYDSQPATISAIDAPAPISVAGGLYKINDGPYTEQAGTVNAQDRVSLLVRASSRSARSVSATLTVGSVAASFTVTTGGALDTVPDSFSFAAVKDARPGIRYVSKPALVTGITSSTEIDVIGGVYRINTGSFSSLAGTVYAGDQVSVEVIASSLGGRTTTATITIGGVSGSFTVTTMPTDPAAPDKTSALPAVR